jgi:hypothetical protein
MQQYKHHIITKAQKVNSMLKRHLEGLSSSLLALQLSYKLLVYNRYGAR